MEIEDADELRQLVSLVQRDQRMPLGYNEV